ncbi:CBS domain-containing protein [Desulfocurvus sp. DL9XJH121]
MLKVTDLMTQEVFTLRTSDTLKTARSMMSLARIRHIPIVGENMEFKGLVTHRDILNATLSQFAEVDRSTRDEIESGIPIAEIMRTDVKTVAPDSDLRSAAELLLNHKYGCLPVVGDEGLMGIITEADFLKLTLKLLEAFEGEPEL